MFYDSCILENIIIKIMHTKLCKWKIVIKGLLILNLDDNKNVIHLRYWQVFSVVNYA